MSTAALSQINASTPLEKSETTTAQLKVVHGIFSDQLNDSAVRKDIRKELETTAKSLVALEADFAKVHANLKNLDDLGVVLDKNAQVIRFAPLWKMTCDEYTALMYKPQETASVLSSQIQDLVEIFLPYIESNASAAGKESRLNEYFAGLDELVKTEIAGANRLLGLRESVLDFQTKLHGVIPKEKFGKLDEDIQKLDGELKILADILGPSGYCAEVVIKLKEVLVKVNKPAAQEGNANTAEEKEDSEAAAFSRLRMKSIKAACFTFQDALDTFALSIAPA